LCYTYYTMSDENSAPHNSEECPSASPEIQAIQPINPQETQQHSASELQDVKKELDDYQRSTLRLTWIIVGINLLTCIFIGLQWYAMQSGSTDTHTLAQAAHTQATKMGNMSDAADKIRQASQDMVAQERRIADNAQKSLAASNRQSQKVLNANITASRLDQRAWLSVEQMATDEEIAENDLLKVHIVIRNTGKTPAQNVVFGWTIHFKLANGTETQVSGNGGAGIVLGPGAQYIEHLRGSEKITKADIANINDPAASFYITIKITYLDVLDKTKQRETDFCGAYSIPDKPLFTTCKAGGYNMN